MKLGEIEEAVLDQPLLGLGHRGWHTVDRGDIRELFGALDLGLDPHIHQVFGEGVVTQFEGRGSNARVEVNFSEGSKWLVLQYANLTVL